ncbi:MAG: hypothetical protein AB8F95_13615 [Bacteroidia bacterium]
MKPILYLLIYSLLIMISACADEDKQGPCDCKLSEDDMRRMCPISAVGDSIVICKSGSIRIAGNPESMSWQAYMESEYTGGVGIIAYCASGEKVFEAPLKYKLNYLDKTVLVDVQFEFDVFDPINKQWVEKLEMPVYQKRIWAKDGAIQVTGDSFILKPPFQDEEAIEQALQAYHAERERYKEYVSLGAIKKLFSAALNGSEEAAKLLSSLDLEYPDYFKEHEWLYTLLLDRKKALKQYQDYLKAGGEKAFFDMKYFLYFQNPAQYKRKQ